MPRKADAAGGLRCMCHELAAWLLLMTTAEHNNRIRAGGVELFEVFSCPAETFRDNDQIK